MSKCCKPCAFIYGGSSTNFITIKNDRIEIGTLIKNTQFQEKFVVSQPPRIGPIIGANNIPTPKTAAPLPCSSCGNDSNIIACEIGNRHPPPKPCNILPNSITPKFGAIPHIKEATANNAIQNKKKFFLPNTFEHQPVAGNKILHAIKNIVIIQRLSSSDIE